jgi:hypothetical protein
METIELKKNITKYIDKINDKNFLENIYLYITQTKSFYNLPEKLKSEIEIAVNEADRNETISHKEAMSIIYEKVNNL